MKRPIGFSASVLMTSRASCVRNPTAGFRHISSNLNIAHTITKCV
jgi:hypothetical protein